MARVQRRRRIRCRLPCELIEGSHRPVRAAVVSLSEGGLGVEAPKRVEQGEPIQLRIMPHRRARTVEVEGIVWYDHPARRARGGAGLRVLGCVVSQPPSAYRELFAEVESRNAPPQPPLAARVPAVKLPVAEPELPRSREPLPPPKPEPERLLPAFRVRLKQAGGPRTRIVSVQARSVTEAGERAQAELEGSVEGVCCWEVLEVARAT